MVLQLRETMSNEPDQKHLRWSWHCLFSQLPASMHPDISAAADTVQQSWMHFNLWSSQPSKTYLNRSHVRSLLWIIPSKRCQGLFLVQNSEIKRSPSCAFYLISQHYYIHMFICSGYMMFTWSCHRLMDSQKQTNSSIGTHTPSWYHK